MPMASFAYYSKWINFFIYRVRVISCLLSCLAVIVHKNFNLVPVVMWFEELTTKTTHDLLHFCDEINSVLLKWKHQNPVIMWAQECNLSFPASCII